MAEVYSGVKFRTVFNRNPTMEKTMFFPSCAHYVRQTTPSHRVGDCSLANARSGRMSENANIPRHSMHHQLQTDGIFAFNNKRAITNDKLQELINWCKEFNKIGFTPNRAGNFSFRWGKGFIINCAGVDFSNIKSEDFTEVLSADINKKEIYVNGIKEPSSESFLHGGIYARRKDVNAIFHGHNEDFLKDGAKLGLPITENEQPYGTLELVKEIVKVLGNNSFILIKNHGFLSLGDSISSAGNLALKRYTQLQRIKRLA